MCSCNITVPGQILLYPKGTQAGWVGTPKGVYKGPSGSIWALLLELLWASEMLVACSGDSYVVPFWL